MPIYVVKEDDIIKKPKSSKEYHKWEEQEKYLQLKSIEDAIKTKEKNYSYKLPENNINWGKVAHTNTIVETADHEKNKAHNIYANGYILERKSLQLPIIQAQTKSEKTVDPAFLIRRCDFETLDLYNSFINRYNILLGGEIISVKTSPLALPSKIQQAARKEVHEYRMASWTPLLVSIENECKYVLPAFSSWGKWGDKTGNMVEESNWETAPAYRPSTADLIFPDDIPQTLIIVEDF